MPRFQGPPKRQVESLTKSPRKLVAAAATAEEAVLSAKQQTEAEGSPAASFCLGIAVSKHDHNTEINAHTHTLTHMIYNINILDSYKYIHTTYIQLQVWLIGCHEGSDSSEW